MSAAGRHSESAMKQARGKVTKKDRILSLYVAGAKGVSELAVLTNSRPSYVAEVLRQAKALGGYFDLYTTTDQPMNIYSQLFAKRLSFRTKPLAQQSVNYIDRLYRHFAQMNDRAGQHHTLVMALTMFNRARWGRKEAEADIFRRWLQRQLTSSAAAAMERLISRSLPPLTASVEQPPTPRTPRYHQRRRTAHPDQAAHRIRRQANRSK